MKYLSVVAGLLLGMTNFLTAQSHLHLRFRPELGAAQLYQPAFVGINDSSLLNFGADGFYGLASNSLSRENIFLSDKNLTEEIKNRILADLRERDNELRLNAGAKAILGFRVGKQALSISYGLNQQIYGRLNNPQTLGLALFGNRRYEDQNLSDEGLRVNVANYQEVGLGTAFHWDKLHLGIRGKLLLGNSTSLVNEFVYTLYTAPMGSRIDAAGSYDIFLSNAGGLDGLGVAADVGLVYEINEKWQLQASLLDLGFINWQGRILQNSFDVSYEGEEIINLDAFGNVNELNGADSLIGLLLPDTVMGNRRQNIGASLHLGVQYQLGPSDLLQLSILSRPQLSLMGSLRPVVNINYQRRLYKQIFIGVNTFVGGLDGFGLGGMLAGNFRLGPSELNLYLQATNVLGLLSPSSRGGNQLSAGVGFRLNQP